MTRRGTICFCALLSLSACAAPRLTVEFPTRVRNAAAGPRVLIAPVQDVRPNPLEASVGYAGAFQIRSDWEVNEETPPALIVQQSLAGDLAQRGLVPAPGGYEVRCQMPQFLLRYRNYAGMFSGTDGWGYLDLVCSVAASGQPVWEGPIYARTHRGYYFAGGPDRGSLSDELWPELTGILVQQVGAILNRRVFHQAASPATLREGARLLRSSDADERFDGAYLLGITGDPAAIPLLAPALGDPEAKVRRSVVDALGTLGAPDALAPLLQRFEEEDGNVQWAILKSILQIGDPQGFEWLRRRLSGLDSDTLREIGEDVLRHPVPSAPAPPVVAPVAAPAPVVAPPPPAAPAGP